METKGEVHLKDLLRTSAMAMWSGVKVIFCVLDFVTDFID